MAITKCPFCAEDIQEGARICRHCKSTLAQSGGVSSSAPVFKCKQCGGVIEKGVKKCMHCGASIKQSITPVGCVLLITLFFLLMAFMTVALNNPENKKKSLIDLSPEGIERTKQQQYNSKRDQETLEAIQEWNREAKYQNGR